MNMLSIIFDTDTSYYIWPGTKTANKVTIKWCETNSTSVFNRRNFDGYQRPI